MTEPDGKVTLQEYWNLRAAKYNVEDIFGRRLLKAYIEKNQLHPRSVVDIGTGPGELLHLFQDVPRVVGLDFSPAMLERAHRRVERHGWKNVELIEQDLTKRHLDEKFELLIGRTVLMHIDPDHIEKAVENCIAMSDTIMILELWEETEGNNPELLRPSLGQWTPAGRKLASHNWIHDYHGLFESKGYRTMEAYRRPDLPQVLFVFKRR